MLTVSESVTRGHPDKMADQISDAVLDAMLNHDPNSRVACETLVTTGLVLVAGEATTDSYVDITTLARNVIREIGYDRANLGFDADTCGILVALDAQSADIAQGVDTGGAGDQGMMFGYATDDTPEFMPLPIALARRLTNALTEARVSGRIPYLRPDGKAQVAIRHERGSKYPVLENVVMSAQHNPGVEDAIRSDLWDQVILSTLNTLNDELEEGGGRYGVDMLIHEELGVTSPAVHINPTGRFVIGGPVGDAGLTGRKIIVDTYGAAAPHGGGAFSGKDPSKVDRSAAYAARWAAKNVVASGLANSCLVKLAYAIGVVDPVGVEVEVNGGGEIDVLTRAVQSVFDFRPAGICADLNLRRPDGWRYFDTAAGGHFGSDVFPWEQLNRVDELRAAVRNG